MSRLYKRGRYFWWETYYKGRRFQKSTKMTRRDLARKITDNWDMNIMMDDTRFLNLNNQSPIDVTSYFHKYLKFVEKRKSDKTFEATKGVLRKYEIFLKSKGIERLDEITVKVMDDYIDWLDNAPKTKKNYVGILSVMFKQAIKEDVILKNPAIDATLPRIPKNRGYSKHRPLERIDLEIIFDSAGIWLIYYKFLLHTGLRAGDVALLKYGNIDWDKKAIISLVSKSRRIHEFPLADHLIDLLPSDRDKDEPIFPILFTDDWKRLNWKLAMPRKHLQTMLKLNDRPKATLHSFRTTFNIAMRDSGVEINDRRILLAHASSETTKIYTHPNFALASEYINKIPVYNGFRREKCRD